MGGPTILCFAQGGSPIGQNVVDQATATAARAAGAWQISVFAAVHLLIRMPDGLG